MFPNKLDGIKSSNKDENHDPADTCRNNNVIITSKRRRFDVIMMLLRHVPTGYTYGLPSLSYLEVEFLFKIQNCFFNDISK